MTEPEREAGVEIKSDREGLKAADVKDNDKKKKGKENRKRN